MPSVKICKCPPEACRYNPCGPSEGTRKSHRYNSDVRMTSSVTLQWCHCSHGDAGPRRGRGSMAESSRERTFNDVTDPEIGHQILQAGPLRGSVLTALTQMGAEPLMFINTTRAGGWSASSCQFRAICWWCWWRGPVLDISDCRPVRSQAAVLQP